MPSWGGPSKNRGIPQEPARTSSVSTKCHKVSSPLPREWKNRSQDGGGWKRGTYDRTCKERAMINIVPPPEPCCIGCLCLCPYNSASPTRLRLCFGPTSTTFLFYACANIRKQLPASPQSFFCSFYKQQNHNSNLNLKPDQNPKAILITDVNTHTCKLILS